MLVLYVHGQGRRVCHTKVQSLRHDQSSPRSWMPMCRIIPSRPRMPQMDSAQDVVFRQAAGPVCHGRPRTAHILSDRTYDPGPVISRNQPTEARLGCTRTPRVDTETADKCGLCKTISLLQSWHVFQNCNQSNAVR